jgi:hypothetical protein
MEYVARPNEEMWVFNLSKPNFVDISVERITREIIKR